MAVFRLTPSAEEHVGDIVELIATDNGDAALRVRHSRYLAFELRRLRAADIAGTRAMTVHVKDDAARSFYERFDFIQSRSDPYHLFLLLKDLCALIG